MTKNTILCMLLALDIGRLIHYLIYHEATVVSDNIVSIILIIIAIFFIDDVKKAE